ncbi:hypothetical protein JHK85_000801 [Glycine max]|nr:hypothetical protein JHK85_000801 [Glycine max]KAG5088171.1 hypothetical protein JHK86_000783 [Glycine max]
MEPFLPLPISNEIVFWQFRYPKPCKLYQLLFAGKLAYRLKNEGAKILMAAGDTFRAATSDQLEIWGERTVCEIVVAE